MQSSKEGQDVSHDQERARNWTQPFKWIVT